MKKIFFSIIVMIVSLSSCSKDIDNNANSWSINNSNSGKISSWNILNEDTWKENDEIIQDYYINKLSTWAKIWNMILEEKSNTENWIAFILKWNIKIKWELVAYYDEMFEKNVFFFTPEKKEYFYIETNTQEHKVLLFSSHIANPELISEKEQKELLEWKKYQVELNITEYDYVWWFNSEEYYEIKISAYKILN